MALSSSLITAFVKATNDSSSSSSSSSTVYGTVVSYSDKYYVKIDGSDQLTPVSTTTEVSVGDRVQVTISDHSATVNANSTSPSASTATTDAIKSSVESLETIVAYSVTTEYLQANYITASEIEAEYLTVDNAELTYATIETLESSYATIEYLTANYITASEIEAEYLTAENAAITYATIETLEADYASIEYLKANYITASTIEATYASIETLTAEIGVINNLFASYATIEYLQANYITASDIEATYLTVDSASITYATITELNSANANITTLTTEVANIDTILSGNIGTGTVQTIYLTGENVVFDEAVITDAAIASLSASKLTAGTIYTSEITIQTASDDESLYISNSLIQISDVDSNVRIQIGLDALNNYNYYIYDESGNVLFDALGITAEGIPSETIVNTHVASKTDTYSGITGDKLDIDSVVSYINDEGTIVVDSSSVQIDDTTLDYKLTEISQTIGGSLSDYTPYYAIWYSGTVAPPNYGDDIVIAYTDDTAMTDVSYLDILSYEDIWSTSYSVPDDGYYVWRTYVLTTSDEAETFGEPACITGDAVARTSTETLSTELSVAQGSIEALIKYTDITYWEDEGTTIRDAYSGLTIELDNITSTVSDITTTISEDYSALESLISEVSQTAESISSTVQALSATVESNYESLSSDISTVSQTASEIEAALESYKTEVSETYATTSELSSVVTQTAEDISSAISALETTVADTYITTEKATSLIEQTSSSLTSTISSLQSMTITDYGDYYCQWPSAEDAPPGIDADGFVGALVGSAYTDISYTDLESLDDLWSDTYTLPSSSEYVWVIYATTNGDDEVSYSDPVLMVGDPYSRSVLEENAERMSSIEQTAESISTTVSETIDYLDSSMFYQKRFYCVWTDDVPPGYFDEFEYSFTDSALTDDSYTDVGDAIWSDDYSVPGDGYYIWMIEGTVYLGNLPETYSDDDLIEYMEFTDPIMITGDPYTTTLIETATTNILQEADQIVSSALNYYVKTSDYAVYKTTLSSTLTQMADEYEIRFDSVEEDTSANTDAIEEYSKYFRFTDDGLEIGEEGNTLILRIDNDMIEFINNGSTIAYWDGNVLYTGNIHVTVSEYARFGNFQWVPRSDGSLMLLKVGD